jgi:hypothetical protein
MIHETTALQLQKRRSALEVEVDWFFGKRSLEFDVGRRSKRG